VNVLDLFSGIGGFSLGLERAGMRTVAFCEIDPYCRRVLARHWPDVPVYDDVRTLTAARLTADGIIPRTPDPKQRCLCPSGESWNGWLQRRDHLADATGQRLEIAEFQRSSSRQRPRSSIQGIDLICGGFPCQDISVAGKGAGIGGERSGLWSEYARIIGEVRPKYVLVENVAALLGRGIERVLGDLAALGYDAEWHCIPASAVGAPHRRDRVWIIAHANSGRQPQQPECNGQSLTGEQAPFRNNPVGCDVADTDQPRPQGRLGAELQQCVCAAGASGTFSDPTGPRQSQPIRSSRPLLDREALEFAGSQCSGWDHWLTEPDVGRVAHGVPARVDRLRALGNAVVPQIPEIIGRAIMTTAAQQGSSPND